MTVYVDGERPRGVRAIMRCMVADSEEELHALAASIGMKREWFQSVESGASFPHYELSNALRNAAIRSGAIALRRREFADTVDRVREQAMQQRATSSDDMKALARRRRQHGA